MSMQKLQLLKIAASILIGYGIGSLSIWQLMPIADNCNIVYVAQDELMELETNRVKQDDIDERQLFFGEIQAAVNLATELPKAYQNRTTKVVYSMSAVTGSNTRSISKEIHNQIIQELSKKQQEKQTSRASHQYIETSKSNQVQTSDKERINAENN